MIRILQRFRELRMNKDFLSASFMFSKYANLRKALEVFRCCLPFCNSGFYQMRCIDRLKPQQ